MQRREDHAPIAEKSLEEEKPLYSYEPQPIVKAHIFSFSEILHLIIGSLIVMGVGLSFIFQTDYILMQGLWVLIGASLIFTSIFLFHELAHKAVAMHNGLWAEFRLNIFTSLITLLSIISPIKFISPGSVMVAGESDKRVMGKIAIAGPAVNLMLASLLFILAIFAPNYPFFLITASGAIWGFWMALLNLIPLGILDGAKVFRWNKVVWATIFCVSIILMFFAIIFFL